mmetsp:Transcript_63319/g.151056  ORF Transcript_63319/g.151056 Transcript_63319/m.151056 type:complete len:463 (+) Transcript_63319:90-1478(+)
MECAGCEHRKAVKRRATAVAAAAAALVHLAPGGSSSSSFVVGFRPPEAARAPPQRLLRAPRRSGPERVQDLVKHPRLPVWPVWLGLVYTVCDLFRLPGLGAALEDRFGGRVCPMLFDDRSRSDPFLLMAHHRHSFNVLDPFRYLFRSIIMPEGFPAHPHRGFETVTYVLRGGLVHRDSMGVKKSYGAPVDSDGSGEGAAVQWMTAGMGMLHEEMWRTGDALDSTDQELFQIWVNLPAKHKMVPPRMQMLGEIDRRAGSSAEAAAEEAGDLRGQTETEVLELGPVPSCCPSDGVVVRVVSGESDGLKSPVQTYSPVTILHVSLEPNRSWTWQHPLGWTCLVYTRKGNVGVGNAGEVLPLHHTATLSEDAGEVAFTTSSEPADLIILAGEPLAEPVASGANIIMNTAAELQEADYDMRAGAFGPIWSHTEDDESWAARVRQHWARMPAWLVRGGAKETSSLGTE